MLIIGVRLEVAPRLKKIHNKRNMKTLKTILAALLISASVFAQNVAINSDGASHDASAILDVKSTSKGFLAPRMTAAQRIGINSPATDARQTKSVAYSEVIPVLTEAIKQQQSQIDALTDENDTLKAQNAAILQRLEALEAK